MTALQAVIKAEPALTLSVDTLRLMDDALPPSLLAQEAVVVLVSLGRALHDQSVFAQLHALRECGPTPAELARSHRFHHIEDGFRHLMGRVLLRRLVGHYLGSMDGRDFGVGSHDKPSLGVAGWDANISHAGDQLAIVIGRSDGIGIDIEIDDAPPGWQAMMSQFHPRERDALLGPAAPAMASHAFSRLWVRKESVCKALGTGFSLPLTAFQIDVNAGPQDWLAVPPPATQSYSWSLSDLPCQPGYLCSLASISNLTRVHRIDLVWQSGTH